MFLGCAKNLSRVKEFTYFRKSHNRSNALQIGTTVTQRPLGGGWDLSSPWDSPSTTYRSKGLTTS